MRDGEHEEEELLLDTPIEEGDENETQQAPAPDEDEPLELEIEGEDEAEDTPLIRTLRQRERDLARENAELRKATAPKPVEIGPKPTLAALDYDEDRYEAALDEWKERKRQAEHADTSAAEQKRVATQRFERAHIAYKAKAQTLKIAGFDDAEKAFTDAMGAEFTGMVVQYAKEPAKLIAAVGKNPALLARVSSESDLVARYTQLIQMEPRIMPKRAAPPPPEAETIQRGTASLARVDPNKELDKLEKEAERTGDRTKIIEWKRKQKAKAA